MVSNQPDTPVIINVDELATKKVDEIEDDLKKGSATNQKVTSWLAILKQIITAADLHRTTNANEKSGKVETGDSIYADYSDDNEQFTTQVDLSEQFETNSVKWTIRVRAFKIIHRLVQLVIASNHDVDGSKPPRLLVTHLPDLVRLAFVAATSPYDELKVQGFEMFRFLIERFASQQDIEIPGHSILEQYKTQFLSAVKPAFNFDAPPYITAIASQICSLWICHGLEKNLADIRRTYQLMLLSIEKLEGQSVNQHSKLYTESELEQERVDILGAWAQLYISSEEANLPEQQGKLSKLSKEECENLSSLVETQIETLVDKWWEAMKDYALLIMPAPKLIGTSHDNDNVYTREVALRLFSPTWPKIVLALTIWLCYHKNKTTQEEDKTSEKKYCKFLCGIFLKELCRCLVDKSNHRKVLPQSTVLTLRSVNSILMKDSTQRAFLDSMATAREFHGALYRLAVLHPRDPNRVLLRQTLDRLFDLILMKVGNDEKSVQYGVAKLICSLMSTMKDIDIASNEKSSPDLDSNRVHLSIQLKSLTALVKFAPKSSMREVPLQVAFISVFQELLRFDSEPIVSVTAAEQLKDMLPSLEDQDIKRLIIDELYPEICARVSRLIEGLISNRNLTSDSSHLSQADNLLKTMRILLGHLEPDCLGKETESYLVSLLSSLNGVEESCDKKRRDLIDFIVSHAIALRAAYPDTELTPKASQLLEAAIDLQTRMKKKLESTHQQHSVTKPKSSMTHARAKIVLKADFSNFYSKKS